jgi:uncharacterized protein YhaN
MCSSHTIQRRGRAKSSGPSGCGRWKVRREPALGSARQRTRREVLALVWGGVAGGCRATDVPRVTVREVAELEQRVREHAARLERVAALLEERGETPGAAELAAACRAAMARLPRLRYSLQETARSLFEFPPDAARVEYRRAVSEGRVLRQEAAELAAQVQEVRPLLGRMAALPDIAELPALQAERAALEDDLAIFERAAARFEAYGRMLEEQGSAFQRSLGR